MAAVADDAAAGAGADATRLDAIVVSGELPPGYGTERTATATRLALSPRETPQSVSVVTRAQMDDFGLNNLNAVLASTTGVNVESVETDRAYYTARGFDITNFQRDGLGIPLPYGIQNGDIDTAIYDRIEILRGANGLLSSTGNPSATVNFVRKRPSDVLDGSARVTLGSWDLKRVDLDVGGPLGGSGRVRGRAVAAWQDNESYLDRYSREKAVGYGVVEADLGADTVLTVGAAHQRNRPRSPMWGALPLYYSDGTPTDYDVSTSTAADWSYWYRDDTRAFAELAHAFAGGWEWRAALNYERSEDDSQLFYVYGTPDRETGDGLFAYPSDYEGRFSAYTLDAYATGPLTLGGRRHDVVIGASFADGDNREVSWYGNDIGTPLPALEEFDGRYPKPSFDAFSDGSDFDFRRDSLYANVRWNLADSFKLFTGANITTVETRGFSYGEPTDVEETRTTPFAGAVLDLGANYSLYASYGEIFAQQAELDADDRLVGPVTGSNLEGGVKGEWFAGRLNASFALFRVRQDNLAEYAGFNTDTGRSFYAGVDAESTGYEVDVAGSLAEHWQITGGFTELDIEGADGGDARTYVPRRMLRLVSVVRLPQVPGLRLGATVRWQSDIHRDQGVNDAAGNAVVTRQESYALVGVMAGYEVDERWDVTLNLDNVTDEKYIPSLYWAQGYYGAPRSVSVAVAYRF